MRIMAACALAITPFLFGDDQEDQSCRSPFHVMHVDVRHTENKGVGYQDGYTTLEAFGIYQNNPNFMPFLDLRGHVFNNGKLAGNVGLGERTVISSINHVFGLYTYYDVRQEEHHFTVQQISPGAELLGKRMEYRVNGYFPIGSDKSSSYQSKFDRFDCKSNRILLRNKRNFALWGLDAEVGTHITQSSRHDFYYGIGPYYFNGDPKVLWGGKTRVYWRYREYVFLEASYSYDHVFKNIVQGTVSFSCPLGPKLKRKGRNCPNSHDLALSRAAFSPYRFEIPVTMTASQTRPAVDPATGKPIRILFVDNSGSSQCKGAFTTLAGAQNAARPGDIIYVFAGDGTTTGMANGIVLQNDQRLFGAGTPQVINTTQGRIRIPPQSSIAPMITGPGIVITLANNNEVSGFSAGAPGGGPNNSAIATPAGIEIVNANIHNNIILTNNNGINIVGSGMITVANNVIAGTNAAFSQGVVVTIPNGQFAQVNILDNLISMFATGVTVQPASIVDNTSSTSTLIAGNTIQNFAQSGILIFNGMPNSTFDIFNNTILDTISTGGGNSGGIVLNVDNPNDAGLFNVFGNTIQTTSTSANTNGINVNNTGELLPTLAKVVLENNNILVGTGAGDIGVSFSLTNAGTINTILTNNQVTVPPGTPGAGINLSAPGGTINVGQSGNIAPTISTNGNVKFTCPTCPPLDGGP